MKKITKKISVTLMLVLALAGQYANAASIRYEGSNVIVSGTVSSKQPGQKVSLQIIGPFDEAVEDVKGALSKDLSSPKELEDTYYTTITTSDGGAYEFSIGGIQIGKFYGIALKEPETPMITSALYVAEQAMLNAVLNKINSASSSADIKAVFETEEYYDMLVNNYYIFNEIES